MKEQVTLTTLGRGAAEELFQRELDRVIGNITDLNTPWKTKRTITLKVAFSPDENRETADVEVICTSKIPAAKGAKTTVFYGIGPEGPVVREHSTTQGRLDFEQDLKKAKVSPLHPVEESHD